MVIGDEEQDLLRLGEEVARFTDADLGMDMGMGMREEDEEDEHMQGMGDDDDQGSEGEEEDEDEEVDDEDAMTDDEAVFEVSFLHVRTSACSQEIDSGLRTALHCSASDAGNCTRLHLMKQADRQYCNDIC